MCSFVWMLIVIVGMGTFDAAFDEFVIDGKFFDVGSTFAPTFNAGEVGGGFGDGFVLEPEPGIHSLDLDADVFRFFGRRAHMTLN